jgi:LEA14-like dessication related protein
VLTVGSRAVWLALLGASLLAGCASLGAPQVTVQLVGIDAETVPAPDAKLAVAVRFVNRADGDVTVDNLAYTLEVNGREFATGVYSSSFAVPRYGDTTIKIAATGTAAAVQQPAGDNPNRLSVSGGASTLTLYRIRGDAKVGFSRMTFDTQSELPTPVPAKPAG